MVEQTDANGQVRNWLHTFERALAGADPGSAATVFGDESYWRDLVAFTWNIKTVEGRAAIAEMATATAPVARASDFALEGDASVADGVTEAWFSFQTAVGTGRGILRLRDGRCWTLLTTLSGLRDHPERIGHARPKGVEHGVARDRRTWLENREAEQRALGVTTQPYCLIVGGGQGGIGLAARLRQLDVPTLIVEKNARPGDSWRKRYKSLCLHDPVWYDHMPYLPFPDNWPVFTPKDKLGDWLEMYTSVMELDYWGSTECRHARYDADAGEWEVHVTRDGEDLVLRPRQLVLATGMSGVPNIPDIPGAESFEGELHHSSQHPGPDAWAGKRCVVLGSNNSAHDICAALWEAGAEVTMIQRSSTHIVRSESLMDVVLGPLYSEDAVRNGIDHDAADLLFASIPYRVLPTVQKPAFDTIRARDADLYRRLAAAGFLLDFGADDSGLFLKYLRRGSGYYIDVGASELVASGAIGLRSGVTIARINPRSVTLSDGSELPADLIVYATGYGSMNGWAAKLISQDVADRVGKCWGLGSDTPKDPGPWEGELRNMWKPTRQPGLWFHGGNLHQSRHYSRFLALQLKARQVGLDTPVHGLQEVHHPC